jgi:hypothetical protein
MTLAERTYKPNRAQSVIETRAIGVPQASIFLRWYEHGDLAKDGSGDMLCGTRYELWRGLYKGYQVLEVFVPWSAR